MTRLAATRHAAVAGTVLAIVMVVATLPSPPNYAIEQLPLFEYDDRIEQLMGIETDGGGGRVATTTEVSTDLLTGDGDEVRTILHYRDVPYELPDGFRTVLEVEEECVRIQVVSTVPPAPGTDRVGVHADYLRQHVRTFLAGAPRDPCLGRPYQP